MNCKELAYMLADYVDGSMDPLLREELDGHLSKCEPCTAFMKTFLATCRGTRRLREAIEYTIPPDVSKRLEIFVRTAALKYPEKVKEYREQVDRDRRKKVEDLVRAATVGRLSSTAASLLESHCAACHECRAYFNALPKAESLREVDPTTGIRSHLIGLMQTLPPGEEFFLA